MLDNTDAFEEAWGDIAARLREINRTLMFSPPSVRYDIQRNIIEILEELTAEMPTDPDILQSIREVAEGMIEGYEGRGRVHIGLRRIADKPDELNNGEQSKMHAFSSLRVVFDQNAKADAYLLDRQLARRSDDGELSLTAWGSYVLEYMDENAEEVRALKADSGIKTLVSPKDEMTRE